MFERWRVPAGLALVAIVVAAVTWTTRSNSDLPEGVVRTNGRIEAERVDIATRFSGRIKDVLVKEGDTVVAGQVLARLDTAEIEAQLKEARAAKRQADQQLGQANALLAQRETEFALAVKQFDRAVDLADKGYTSRETVDRRESAKIAAEAAINAAKAEVALAAATIEAAEARVDRLMVDLEEFTLKAPRGGRVEYRLALPGEMLPAGGKVLTVLDLTDVYMTVFLPTSEAGVLKIGGEARLVFDAAPQYVIPANVSFVASDAQFTPKYVETKIEREKLMFRVKLHIPKEILERYSDIVKTGVPGVAYVKLLDQAEWPESLSVKLPS